MQAKPPHPEFRPGSARGRAEHTSVLGFLNTTGDMSHGLPPKKEKPRPPASPRRATATSPRQRGTRGVPGGETPRPIDYMWPQCRKGRGPSRQFLSELMVDFELEAPAAVLDQHRMASPMKSITPKKLEPQLDASRREPLPTQQLHEDFAKKFHAARFGRTVSAGAAQAETKWLAAYAIQKHYQDWNKRRHVVRVVEEQRTAMRGYVQRAQIPDRKLFFWESKTAARCLCRRSETAIEKEKENSRKLRKQMDELRQKLTLEQQNELLREELLTHHQFSEGDFDKELAYIEEFVEANLDYAHVHRCDLTAARIYTRNEIYSKFNADMRATTAPDSPADEWKSMYYHLRNAVREVVGVPGGTKLFRGQPEFYGDDEGAKARGDVPYKEGASVRWKDFKSASKKRAVAEEFAGKSGVVFEIETPKTGNFGANFCTKAAKVGTISVYPNEDEILLPPGSTFKVTERSMDGDVTVVSLQYKGDWADLDEAMTGWPGPLQEQWMDVCKASCPARVDLISLGILL